jgi:cell pole-organizing protein PopZ
VSDDAASASRDALAALSALLIKPEGEVASNTLEGLVREMLRPMLKEWLDARLPELVQSLVEKEIARISGRGL